MRATCWLILSFALLVQNPGAEGQDVQRPAAPDAKAKRPESKAPQIQFQGMQFQLAPQQGGGLDGTLDRLIKDLEDLRRELKKTKEGSKVQGEPKRDFRPGGQPGFPPGGQPGQPGFPQGGPGPQPGQPGFPQGGPGPQPGQPGFPPGGSHVDQKLDMILGQMDEMRRDIKELQKRLPPGKGMKGQPFGFKSFFGPKAPMKDKESAPPQAKEADAKPEAAVQRAVQYLQERQRERQQTDENAKLKQQIERLQREVEQLRNASPAK